MERSAPAGSEVVMFLNVYILKETIMEMGILVLGVGAIAVWFFMSKDGRKE